MDMNPRRRYEPIRLHRFDMSDEQKKRILLRREQGESYATIAKRFGIAPESARRVCIKAQPPPSG